MGCFQPKADSVLKITRMIKEGRRRFRLSAGYAIPSNLKYNTTKVNLAGGVPTRRLTLQK
jgi:hypothetical protein